MIKQMINFNYKRMKTHRFIYIIGVLFLYFGAISCEKEEGSAPSVKGYLNGTEVREIMVTLGTTVNFKFEIQSMSSLTKVEVFVRKGIGLGTESQLFLRKEAVAGDMDGNSLIVEGSLILSTDLMISIGAINSEGKITILQLNALLDISEFDDLTMMDVMADGTSKSFCSSQYGLLLFAANTLADPAAIDFGFIYMESNQNVKASLVSFSDFGKTATYPVVGANNNVTLFKRALAYTNTDAASLQQSFSTGTDFPSVLGIDAGKAAANLTVGDVIAFKTQQGNYGLILVKSIYRKNEDSSNQQTIKLKLVVQK